MKGRLLSAVIAFTMLFCSTTSYANSKNYSAEEVKGIIIETYNECGVTAEWVDVLDRAYTQAEVDALITEIRKSTKGSDSAFDMMIEISDLNFDIVGKNQCGLMYMENKRTRYYQEYLTNNMYSGATIVIELNATVNLGSNTYVNVDSVKSYHHGYSLNFDNWKEKEIKYTYSSDMKTVYVTAKGDMTTTVSILGIANVGTVKEHTISTSFSL